MTNSANDAEQPITRTTRVGHGNIPANERSYHIGGLMRCCTETLHNSTALTIIGSVIVCVHCREKAVVGEDGAWRWAGRS